MSSCSAASRREAPPSTRAITRMRMSAEYAFGIVRPPDESMPPDSPIYRSLGILRFYSARTCSRCGQIIEAMAKRAISTETIPFGWVEISDAALQRLRSELEQKGQGV